MTPANTVFSPSWRRGLLVFAIALAGFCLPQEIPLEWYPLNEPGNDIDYLEISCAADGTGGVQILYDAGKGWNERDSIRFPISATSQTYTYDFPLPDAPMMDLRLAPLSGGGTLTIRQMRIIDRRGTEMRRFTRETFEPVSQIASIDPLPDGWKIVSEKNATAPLVHIPLAAPLLAKGINHRNLLRCVYSSSYLALMLWILLLAALFTFYRPHGWSDAFSHVGFMAIVAILFSVAGNRGLIKNSVRYALFVPPVIAPGAALEFDLRIEQPLAAQLFWDTGNGFREEDSIRCKYAPHSNLQTISIPLPSLPLKQLRFDPLDGDATVVIRGIKVVDQAKRTVAVIPLKELQAESQIAQCSVNDEALTIVPVPGSKDPILGFTATAVTAINQAVKIQNHK